MLEAFVYEFNERFAKPAKSPHDAHRRLRYTDKLDEIFCLQQSRKLSRSFTFQYKNALFALVVNRSVYGLQRKRVRVLEHRDGRIEVRHGRKKLRYRIVESRSSPPSQGRVVDPKELSGQLEATQLAQALAEAPFRTRPAQLGPRTSVLSSRPDISKAD